MRGKKHAPWMIGTAIGALLLAGTSALAVNSAASPLPCPTTPVTAPPVTVSATVTVSAPTPSPVYVCAPVGTVTPTTTATTTVVTTPPQQTITSSPIPTQPPIDLNPSGQVMPATDLPGWTYVFGDTFGYAAKAGTFLSMYPNWTAYPKGWLDTAKLGAYNPDYLSVAGGLLDIHLAKLNGVPQVNAPMPNKGTNQLYGRYSVRFMATGGAGYKTAWLLWPQSEKWPADGEVDWPEGGLTGTMQAFAHYADPNGGQDAFGTSATYTGWHTATTEWSPGKLVFYLDGQVIGTSTHEVPSTPMRWVLQTETGSSSLTDGDVFVDWVAMYALAG